MNGFFTILRFGDCKYHLTAENRMFQTIHSQFVKDPFKRYAGAVRARSGAFRERAHNVADITTSQPSATVLSRRSAIKGASALGGAAVFASLGLGTVLNNSASAQEGSYAIFASTVDIPNIDPAVGHDGAISISQKSLYDTLYRHVGNPVELTPWLATGHTVSEDGLT